MDLRQLKTFLKVAELGSLSKASDQLRIVQPALSRQIRLLEEAAGTSLFSRKSTGMRLTAAGKELCKRIASPVRQIESAISDMRSLAVVTSGQVTLGMLSTVSYALAGRLGYRVATEFPDIALRITEGYSQHLTEWLQRGDVHAAITYGPAADLHMKTTELLVEELVLVGSPRSDLKSDRPILASDLGKMPLILPSNPNGLRLTVQRGAEKAGSKLQVRIEADSFRAIKELVAQDLGYTVLPLSSFSRELRKGEFKYCPIRRPKLTRQLILAHPVESELSPAALKIVHLALEELTSMVKEGDLVGHMLFNRSSLKTPRSTRRK